MKKSVLVLLISLLIVTKSFAKDLTFTKNVSMREIDKIEFVNCTRHSDLKGYATTSNDKAVGFYLKQTGDKDTVSVGDWRNINSALTIVLFDIDFEVELNVN